jgi:23S rRNA pseudouridine2605 synthase
MYCYPRGLIIRQVRRRTPKSADRRNAPHTQAGRNKKVGLARALSKMGVCSRSEAARIIEAGRVQLNGAVKRNPETPVNFGSDRIEVDGSAAVAANKIYVVLNKPRGTITTASDEKGRETVYDLLPPHAASPKNPMLALVGAPRDPVPGRVTNPVNDREIPWIAPVGRLDKASEGLLLLTNDSEWAARVLAPDTHLDKTYHVQIAQIAGDELLSALRKGIASEGEWLRVKRADRLRSGEKNSWLEIVLDEGKNRHIRRMLEALGAEVLRLVRVAIGPLSLGDLAKGASRPLTPSEKTALDLALSRR